MSIPVVLPLCFILSHLTFAQRYKKFQIHSVAAIAQTQLCVVNVYTRDAAVTLSAATAASPTNIPGTVCASHIIPSHKNITFRHSCTTPQVHATCTHAHIHTYTHAHKHPQTRKLTKKRRNKERDRDTKKQRNIETNKRTNEQSHRNTPQQTTTHHDKPHQTNHTRRTDGWTDGRTDRHTDRQIQTD